jgi:hypothetical protein
VFWHTPHDSLHSEPFLFPILLINAIFQFNFSFKNLVATFNLFLYNLSTFSLQNYFLLIITNYIELIIFVNYYLITINLILRFKIVYQNDIHIDNFLIFILTFIYL